MESVLIDQSLVNPRKNVVVNNSSSYGGFMTRSHNTFSSSYYYSSVSQLFHNLNAGTGGSMASFGSRPPASRYSSLPSFSAAPSVVVPPPAFPPPLHQPPLLPLPFSKSATLPSPNKTKRIAAAVTTARSRDNRNKTKPDGNPRKEARSSGTTSVRSNPPKGEPVSVVPQKSAQKSASRPAVAAAERKEKLKEGGEEEEQERFAMESVYSLSPPPSSLPLPTFFLKRPKAASAASCVAEAMGCGDAGGGGRVNAGATDDLRRLLRL